MGIRTDLFVTEEIAETSDLRATPFEFGRAKRVEAALSILEGKWKIVVLNRLHILQQVAQLMPHLNQRIQSRVTRSVNFEQGFW